MCCVLLLQKVCVCVFEHYPNTGDRFWSLPFNASLVNDDNVGTASEVH